MGEADRFHEFQIPKRRRFHLGEDGNSLLTLVVINLVFFVFLLVMQVSYLVGDQSVATFHAQFMQWFALPSEPLRFIQRPWTALTFVFSDNFSHIIRLLSNLIWLWVFGLIFQQYAGNDKLIPVYLYGGFGAALVFILSHLWIPNLQFQQHTLLGANAGVMAVATAATWMAPSVRFFEHIRGGISIWWVWGIYVLINIAGAYNGNLANSLAFLGAAGAGVLFVVFLRKGKDGSLWMNRLYSWIKNLFDPIKNTAQHAVKEKMFYKTGNRPPFTKTPIITEQRINEILDKINQKGYASLSKDEKAILKKASEDDNL